MEDRNSSKKRKQGGWDNGQNWKKRNIDSGRDNVSVLAEAPRELRIADYAKSHAAEIEALSESICKTDGAKNIQQQLPKHMRRRAMSHNIKRLPRSLHAMAKHLYVNQKGLVTKTPSRYHRRRPKNLLQEYTRRQRKHIWLETHIWHAKRFHMVEKWGFKLPWKPTEKSERAAYRATSRHCLLQDMSYMCSLEVTGPQDVILDGVSHVTNPQTGQTFAAVSCQPGNREGHTVMYEYNKYPFNAIGPVTFMWNPSQPIKDQSGNEATNLRQLWVWCHPCCFDQVWQEFVKCLQLVEVTQENKEEKAGTDMEVKNITDIEGKASADKEETGSDKKEKESCKKIGSDDNKGSFIVNKYKTNVTAVNKNKSVTMKSLTGSILRFRLTGPQSTAVLVDALQQANIVPDSNINKPDLWWKTYYSKAEMSLGHVTQREFFESLSECQSPAELPPRCVVAMTTRDPRLTRPVKRTKVESSETGVSCDMTACREKITSDISTSALWDSRIRDEVTTNKQTDYKIHQLKSEHLVPGTPLELGDEEARIPVIIIQRPGVVSPGNAGRGHNPNPGRGSGWDLLLPRGWGMPFWLSLVFRGARCGGLREGECIAHEEKSLLFPNDFPDTLAGSMHQIDLEKESVNKYNRRPPAKRPNFTKYGVVSPFSPPWNWLLKDWEPASGSNKGEANGDKESVLQKVENGDNSAKILDADVGEKIEINVPKIDFCVLRSAKLLRRLQETSNFMLKGVKQLPKETKTLKETISELEKFDSNALVPIRVNMVHRGTPEQFAMVCIPTEDDLKQLIIDKNYGGPTEPIHADPSETEKQKLKQELKVKMMKKKVKVDRTMKMIGDKKDVLVNTCCRRVIGYLNSGGFSLGTGNGSGLGLVAAQGLVHLLESKSGWMVLVRNTSTLQYRFARMSVVL